MAAAAIAVRGVGGRMNSKVFMTDPPMPMLADLLDGRDDVGIGAAAADVAAHELPHVGIGGAAGSLSSATADMIWPEVQ